MKKLSSYLLTAITFFIIGYFSHQSPAAPALISVNQPCEPTKSIAPPKASTLLTQAVDVVGTLAPSVSASYFERTLKNAGEDELQNVLGQFIGSDAIEEHIDDIALFSTRLLTEFTEDNVQINQDSNAEIRFSFKDRFPEQYISHFDVTANERLYAHIDVKDGLGIFSQKLFIKWRNLDTGDILLFTQKSIREGSQQNWVSFKPNSEWVNGQYQVTFYQFNSSLEPLVSDSYTLQRID